MGIDYNVGYDPAIAAYWQPTVDVPTVEAPAAPDVQQPAEAAPAPSENATIVQDAAALDFGDMPWLAPVAPAPPPPPLVAASDVLTASYKAGGFGYTNPLAEMTYVDPDQVARVVSDLLTTGHATLHASIDSVDPETGKITTLTSAELTLDPQTLANIKKASKKDTPAQEGAAAFSAAWNQFAAANYVTGVPKAYGVHLDAGPIERDDPVKLREIQQFRGQDTCEAAAIQKQLARTNPEEYNRVMTDLLTQGYAAIPGYTKGVIQLDEANKKWINDPTNHLSDAEKKNAAFQSAMTSALNNDAQSSNNNQYSSTWANYSLANGSTTLTTATYTDSYDEYGYGGSMQTGSSDAVVQGGPVRQGEDLIKAQGGVYFSLPQADQALQGDFLRTDTELRTTEDDQTRVAAQSKLDSWDHGARREAMLQSSLDGALAGGQDGVWICVRTSGDAPADPAGSYVANGDGQALAAQYTSKTGAPPPQDPDAKYHWTQLTDIKDGVATLSDGGDEPLTIPVSALMTAMAKSDDINAGAGGGAASVQGAVRVRG
ncbi:MAG: hypothetical protein JWM80_226 [Cyanobacteria bacterium RYN_339]|nr:hypothetical protein [Cyanobacteria bacterium RYN_339]